MTSPKEPVRRATIRDVAAQAGVSKSLVSLVFSDPEAVSEQRRQRVLEVATRIGYRPNFLARTLAGNSGNFIAIVAANLHNPMFAEMVDRVRLELSGKGEYAMLTSATLPAPDGPPVIDERTMSQLMDLNPKALLVVGTLPDFTVLAQVPKHVPIVVTTAAPVALQGAVVVRTDDAGGMRLVVEHLVAQGHSRIAHISGRTGPVAELRKSGYLAAMKAHGLTKHSRVEEILGDLENQGYEVAKRLIRDPRTRPTAIASFNDLLAIGALDAVTEWVEAGGDPIAVTGFDDTFLASLRRYSLTTVNPNNVEIAQRAAELLLSPRSQARKLPEFLVSPRLVVRNSSRI